MLGTLYRILFAESRLGRRVRHRRQFPGLAVHDLAEMQVEGHFSYGTGASIGDSSIVLVPAGASLELGAGTYVGRQVEVAPGRISIGARTSVQDRTVLLGAIQIGRYCTLAYGIYASSGDHRFDLDPPALIKDQDARAASHAQQAVVIEDDCWIGNGVFIAAGVRIGKGAVVGANSVVTHDVPPYCVVAGAPARVLRQRLEFCPPKRISHARSEDLPYFYSGFRVAEDERASDRVSGGLIAEGPFTLALDAGGASRVKVKARCVSGNVRALALAGSSQLLGRDFSELEFPLSMQLLTFTPSDVGEVCVEGAWVE